MSNEIERKRPWIIREGKRAGVGLAAGLVAVVGVTTYASLSGPRAGDAETSLTSVVQQQRATAPRFVSGYSLHCSQRMAERNVTGPEVDQVVQNYYLSAEYDDDAETWRYPGPTLIVVLNVNGLCTSVFRP